MVLIRNEELNLVFSGLPEQTIQLRNQQTGGLRPILENGGIYVKKIFFQPGEAVIEVRSLSVQEHLEDCLSTKYKILNTLEYGGGEDEFLFCVKNDFLEIQLICKCKEDSEHLIAGIG